MIYLLQWDDDLILDVTMMDEHHKQLLEILNKCYRALMLNDHHQELEVVMTELSDYTHYHFESEKKLMDEFAYQESAAHLDAHAQFTDMIAKFQNRFESGESLVAMDVLQFLQKWLLGHIKQTDRAFAAFIKEKGAV